ncbi:GTPase IMAP family member 7-like [Sphaeramia orbicularis]|uniref:GTPase IMAP family member 7-like n=1 Tax=Sphaeramia orbicularis TaxID=375764 RepID=UPI00117C4793|nr:GTPase IMAP family member 7-like [Sphaeramia orbicularis]XP_029985315.1 GTPase IMAP family member 7-like [Sphaeramia orbicularis]
MGHRVSIPRGPPVRIVMIGKTGVGKSAVGNTIVNKKAFISLESPESVTAHCRHAQLEGEKREVHVVDTPGILDTSKSVEVVKKEIIKCIQMSTPGPHVFLLVLQIGRFTKEEENCVDALEKLFGPEMSKYMIVLFSHGDKLTQQGTTIFDYLRSGHPKLTELLNRCGNRFHVFNNKDKKNRKQVAELIKKIDEMVAANRASYYSDDMFEAVDRTQRQPDKLPDGTEDLNVNVLSELLQRIIQFQATLSATTPAPAAVYDNKT